MNWLAAQEGKFNLIMRLYWSQPQVLDGTWAPPAVTKVEKGPRIDRFPGVRVATCNLLSEITEPVISCEYCITQPGINFAEPQIARCPRRFQDGVSLSRTYHHPSSKKMQCRRRTEGLVLRALCVVRAVTILQGVGMGLGSSRFLQARQPAEDIAVATTVFETQFDGPPPGLATLSVATITLAPGQATFSLEGDGSLVILVESGTVTLLIDHVIDGLPQVEDDNASHPEITYRLRAGQRVTIPHVGTMKLRNEGDEASNLLLLTLVSEGGPSLPDMLANS